LVYLKKVSPHIVKEILKLKSELGLSNYQLSIELGADSHIFSPTYIHKIKESTGLRVLLALRNLVKENRERNRRLGTFVRYLK
jgi:hypothetical protein